MSNQPFFSASRIRQLAIYFCGAIALVIGLGWTASHYTSIKIDWSFLVPLGGVVGALIPIVTGIIGYLDKRLKENDERLDKLEILAAANCNRNEESSRDRNELRKIILKLEARIESIRDERIGNQMGKVEGLLLELLQKQSNTNTYSDS